jgi:SnoaL-like domain
VIDTASRVTENDLIARYRDVIDAWNRRDLVWILEQATPDFEFHTAQIFPGIEPVYIGREGMVEFWTSFVEAPWALLRLDVEELRAVGDERVLALLTFTGIERGSATEVTLKYAHLATFRGEEVARVQAFSDWNEARAAAELDG